MNLICEKEKIKSEKRFYFFISALLRPSENAYEKEKIKSEKRFYFFISALLRPSEIASHFVQFFDNSGGNERHHYLMVSHKIEAFSAA